MNRFQESFADIFVNNLFIVTFPVICKHNKLQKFHTKIEVTRESNVKGNL